MGIQDAKASWNRHSPAGYTGFAVGAISWKDQDDTRWIRLSGELDTEEYQRISTSFRAAIREAGGAVVIDLAEVVFVSSDGMRMLLEARNHQRALGREIHLHGLAPAVRKALATTGVLDAIPEWTAGG